MEEKTIYDTDLSARACNVLISYLKDEGKENHRYVSSITNIDLQGLRRHRGAGASVLKEVKEFLIENRIPHTNLFGNKVNNTECYLLQNPPYGLNINCI